MRRFRRLRRRRAAFALLPLAALTTVSTTAFAAPDRDVPYGKTVTLRGALPGASNAALEILHQAQGSTSWELVRHAQTGADGRYSVRIKPRQSGYWRAGPADGAGTPTAARSSTDTRITVHSRTSARIAGRHATVGDRVTVRGKVMPAGAERRVAVRIGGSKQTVDAAADGSFAVDWDARSTGTHRVKVIARSNRVAAGSRERVGRVTVYRPAAASWYGPGLYGNRTACGGTLTPSTLGVAHRSMPCGTRLRLRYGGRTVAVRVIDRGPFAGNREFDLTSATKQRLGFPDTGTVLSSR